MSTRVARHERWSVVGQKSGTSAVSSIAAAPSGTTSVTAGCDLAIVGDARTSRKRPVIAAQAAAESDATTTSAARAGGVMRPSPGVHMTVTDTGSGAETLNSSTAVSEKASM